MCSFIPYIRQCEHCHHVYSANMHSANLFEDLHNSAYSGKAGSFILNILRMHTVMFQEFHKYAQYGGAAATLMNVFSLQTGTAVTGASNPSAGNRVCGPGAYGGPCTCHVCTCHRLRSLLQQARASPGHAGPGDEHSGCAAAVRRVTWSCETFGASCGSTGSFPGCPWHSPSRDVCPLLPDVYMFCLAWVSQRCQRLVPGVSYMPMWQGHEATRSTPPEVCSAQQTILSSPYGSGGPSAHFKRRCHMYLLTSIDRTTRWVGAIPPEDHGVNHVCGPFCLWLIGTFWCTGHCDD
jgi:hypothetical protein